MDKDAALKWLTWLYGEQFEGHVWIGGHVDGFKGRLFAGGGALLAAVDYAAVLDDAGAGLPMAGVYHRLTTMREVGQGRGKVEDSISLPAFMADLDLRGPGHKSDLNPETEAHLHEILAAAGVPEPSTWIDSGGGRYPVWKLDAPAPVWDADVLAAMRTRSAELHAGIIAAAKSMGFKIDNTRDLARVYRLPGTTNRKPGCEPVIATWAGADSAVTYPARAVRPAPQRTPERVEAPVERERIEGSSVSTSVLDWQGGMAGLFGDGSGASTGPRGFTLAQAMAFVQPALEALRTAEDGEINVRLNDAACALAHFGPEFWGEDAADRQMYAALDATVYDGLSWKAADTIASARRAMAGDWRAVLVPTPPSPEALDAAAAVVEIDAVDALLAEMLSPDDIISRPAPKFVVHGLLQFDSESWIIGPAGGKKSFIVLDIAARVLRGEPWQGRRTNPADVVMIVAEGAGGVGKRVDAWRRRYGAMPEGLYILPRPVQSRDVAAWAVLAAACSRLADSARARGRGLVVVLDTQARVTVGLKENDATDMGLFIHAVGAIRQATGACVLTVHHTGRAGADARGSSAIDGAQTTELSVVPSRGNKLTGELRVTKQKDIEEIDPIRLAFEVVDVGRDEDGMALTSLVLCEQDSTAFRLAWAGAEAGQEVTEEAPFKSRETCEAWITARRPKTGQAPVNEWWIMQALVDTAKTTGLTQAEMYAIVQEKRGKIDKTTFKNAWQRITEDGGRWADVMLNVEGQRWTVDPMAVESARRVPEEGAEP